MDTTTTNLLTGRRGTGVAAAVLLALVIGAPAHAHPHSRRAGTRAVRVGTTMRAKATYYASRLNGRKTANGERFHQNEHTAATNMLPLDSKAAVTNLRNGRSTEVRVTDRRPRRHRSRIDLSRAAASDIGIGREQGTAPVQIKVTEVPPAQAH
jgi:rare lipoprotein A